MAVALEWFGDRAGVPGLARRNRRRDPLLVQEQPGFHLGISPTIEAAARDAAQTVARRYAAWLEEGGSRGESRFRRDHFTIAVGGGNTVKNEYRALLAYHGRDIDWLGHVRFFLLEGSCHTGKRESARDALVAEFIEPLARKLIVTRGARELRTMLGLSPQSSYAAISRRMVEAMIVPVDMDDVEQALRGGDRQLAIAAARREARRYQSRLRELLGPSMRFHLVISGVGRDGSIGALTPYLPELKRKSPAALVLERGDGTISVALNRGVLTSADCVSLIISGSRKLRALGRFEMEDSAPFERTVMETPIRMLRETRDIAEKVYIFADDRALHFDEGVFRYRKGGTSIEVKAELRAGDEPGGIHILLVHGFMGLYSYINLLLRLPSAWTVSALRRGKHAKTLPDPEVFPHYADSLRKIILQNWRSQRPTPVCCHSMAGVISDHLLLSILDNLEDELPDFERLAPQDQRLIEALRAGGVIHIATWAPSDLTHLRHNVANLKNYRRGESTLDFSTLKGFYQYTTDGRLELRPEIRAGLKATPAVVGKMIGNRCTEMMINAMNGAVRLLVRRVDLQRLLKQHEAPYGQRLLGKRVLQRASFYGVLKEMNASMHDPGEYQRRHMKALEAIVKYDIPYLVIVHRDDFMVSANRHVEEHDYLLQARKAKERVRRERDLTVPVGLVLLAGDGASPDVDLVDPHFLILSTTHKGAGNARKVTAAITAFVNENVARAASGRRIPPLASVEKWWREHRR